MNKLLNIGIEYGIKSQILYKMANEQQKAMILKFLAIT